MESSSCSCCRALREPSSPLPLPCDRDASISRVACPLTRQSCHQSRVRADAVSGPEPLKSIDCGIRGKFKLTADANVRLLLHLEPHAQFDLTLPVSTVLSLPYTLIFPSDASAVSLMPASGRVAAGGGATDGSSVISRSACNAIMTTCAAYQMAEGWASARGPSSCPATVADSAS